MDNSKSKSNRPKSRQSIATVPSRGHALLDNNNATTDLSSITRGPDANVINVKRKIRGKSIGPGGLEALAATSGNIVKTAPTFPIKSILKPSVPLTPPKAIPTFDELRKRNTANKTTSPSRKEAEELLIDFSTPAPNRNNDTSIPMTGAEHVADPFSPITRKSPRLQNGSNTRTEREEEEDDARRQAQKQAILDRRAARRKSLANRRVSFAPEATLHTWSVMELPEDSTTSSASNSTRRQSSMTTSQSPAPPAQLAEGDLVFGTTPNTPVEQIEDPLVPSSPAHQRDLHQKKMRRRSSSLSEADLEASMEQVLSSSPSGDIVQEDSPIRVAEGIDSDDDSDTDGDTAMDLDEATSNTVNSQHSSSTQSSLDERLRLAANQAGTRGIEYDEHGDDVSMEIATNTVTNAFQPWIQNRDAAQEHTAMFDQENVNPFSAANKAQLIQQMQPEQVEEMDTVEVEVTMELTKAVGGILRSQVSPVKKKRQSINPRRRSSVGRRRSSDDDASIYDDESMDLTMAAGGILSGQLRDDEDEKTAGDVSDEDMTMEFTNVLGGVLGRQARRESMPSFESSENETMDMTVAVGGILPPIEEQTEPQTDAENEDTAPMEMTRAIGRVLATLESGSTNLESGSPRDEVSHLTPIVSTNEDNHAPLTPEQTHHLTSVASETGSPSLQLKPRLSGRSKTPAATSTTPKQTPKGRIFATRSPGKEISTPTHQLTPLPTRAETPSKTPIITNVTQRTASPKKLFRNEIKARPSPAAAKKDSTGPIKPLFSRDETGQHTPSIVLKAPRQHLHRRSSGIGVDREGLGSPRVSDLLDRRSSIGENAPQFKLKQNEQRSIRFENPREIEQEVDAERAEEHRRESGRVVMEVEANEQQEENATLQLKEMIASMTPQKKPALRTRGRKSLAVGAAKGLLGKRPAELDLEDDDSDSTPKRLKAVAREDSPMKKIHLPKPPTKAETTGRLTRADQKRLESLTDPRDTTPSVRVSPSKNAVPESPQNVSRFKNIPPTPDRPTSFEDKMDNVVGAIDVATAQAGQIDLAIEEEKISLQSFLNMTNIHFIELSTTKRRHTLAPTTKLGDNESDGTDFSSTQSRFVTAATTLPLLELYQHATRELKTYISSGRKIIRSIEAETWNEQPLLFREYIDARPDVKSVMDNQFRNGKANARLRSKEGWYSWRSQLVEGLKAGLVGIKDNMTEDLINLDQQQEVLDYTNPILIEEKDKLVEELKRLESNLDDLNSVDQEVLFQQRKDLMAADAEYEAKSMVLAALQQEMQDKEETLASAKELKLEIGEQIAEADRVREEHRGWPVKDVLQLKSQVENIEKESGWRVITAEEDLDEPSEFGTALVLTYRSELRLFFYPTSFASRNDKAEKRRSGRKSKSTPESSAPISLTVVTEDDEDGTRGELPTEKRFFLQLIRSRLHEFAMAPRGTVSATTVLKSVSTGWDLACKLTQELRLLDMTGIVTTSILADEKLGIKLVLMTGSKSRIDMQFELTILTPNVDAITPSWSVHAHGVYGPESNCLTEVKCRKIHQALSKELDSRDLGSGACIGAVHGFESWLQKQNTSESKETTTKANLKSSVPAVQTSTASDINHATTQHHISVSTVTKSTSHTQSANHTSTTPGPKRSPLATKKSNLTVKKALPIPIQRAEKLRDIANINGGGGHNKENIVPPSLIPIKGQDVVASENLGRDLNVETNVQAAQFKGESVLRTAAMPPEMQEALMNAGPMTPIKRVGALRRSPI